MINAGYEQQAIRTWKWPILLLLVCLAAAAGVYIIYEQSQKLSIGNYEECVAAGYPSMESFPAQCIANGRTFIQEIDPSKIISP